MVRVGGATVVMAWNNSVAGSVDQSTVNSFRVNITNDPTFAAISVPFPTGPFINTTSWLRLYFSNATSESYTLQVWQQLPAAAFSGIAPQHVQLIAVELWANMTYRQAARLTRDVIGLMSPQQFLAIQAPAIRSIYFEYWDAVSPAILSQLSPAQVANIYSSSFSRMFCYQLQAFSQSQFSESGNDVKNSYASVRR
jgi:hypothetical protein